MLSGFSGELWLQLDVMCALDDISIETSSSFLPWAGQLDLSQLSATRSISAFKNSLALSIL